jgi:hypothetical protein
VLWSLRLCLTLIIQAAAGAGQPRRKYGNLRRRDLDRMRGYRRWDARLGGDVVVADDLPAPPIEPNADIFEMSSCSLLVVATCVHTALLSVPQGWCIFSV